MRYLQILVFVVGLAAFIAAIFFVGTGFGDTLWRVGVAALLLDVMCIMLWPAPALKIKAIGSCRRKSYSRNTDGAAQHLAELPITGRF
jgi:hypothetical protein